MREDSIEHYLRFGPVAVAPRESRGDILSRGYGGVNLILDCPAHAVAKRESE